MQENGDIYNDIICSKGATDRITVTSQSFGERNLTFEYDYDTTNALAHSEDLDSVLGDLRQYAIKIDSATVLNQNAYSTRSAS